MHKPAILGIAFGSIALAVTLAASLTLDITPYATYDYNGVAKGVVTFAVGLPHPAWVCTGWQYQDEELDPPDAAAYRRSCEFRHVGFTQEWPVPPYVGDYIGFAELYATSEARSPEVKVTKAFRVLEGIPPG